jgi:energy-coupling factor transporter transmembrane protein EcfT
MYRSALDLQQEAKRMIDARYSRSSNQRWGTNIYTYKVLGYMVGGILVRAFLRKDQRRDALYSRNFAGTLYHKKKPFRFNGLLLLWLCMILAILTIMNVTSDYIPIGVRY